MIAFPKPKNYCKCGCGTEIKATRKYVSGHNFKRRPKGATVIKGRSYVDVKCTECGNTFKRRTDQINKPSFVNLCSKECRSSYQSKQRKGKPIPNARNGTYKRCKFCKEEFYVSAGQKKRNFCSKKCNTNWIRHTGYVPENLIKSVDNKGKNNGMYIDGRTKPRSQSKAKIRKKVIERDGGNWCLLCGKPGPGLHLHRIVYGSQGGKYEVDNCVQLCAECHGKVHSNKRKWMSYLQDYLAKKKEDLYEKT